MVSNWAKIWRKFKREYNKKCCDWPGQKKMIRAIVDSYYEGNDINWKQVWKEFELWTDSCPTCNQKCNNGFHTEWGGEDGQEKELERLLKVQVNLFKTSKRKVSA